MPQSPCIAVVTGGGSGIGAATSLALAADGWTVVVAGRRAAPLADVARRADALAGTIIGIPTDVGDEGSVRELFSEVSRRFSRLDLLFNNAGISAPAAFIDELDLDAWNDVMRVTLGGAFLCTREAFHLMRAQDPRGGRIINNGSISAHSPRPLSTAYTVAKHAITGLTKSTSLDGRAFDIACGQIDIGNAATDMGGGASQGTLQADGEVRPEPVMDVEDVARAVLTMASLPLAANVASMTIMATAMPFVGRG
ncbi:MAG: 3-oxoacyl-ACP reductase [Frondihabitans sp.]|nr:3-oxoacyl-ACP reductase [Frondihabitans sp.]